MRLIKTFLQTLTKTLSKPEYYFDITKAHLTFSLKFFCGFFCLYALIGTFVYGFKFVLPISNYISLLPLKLEQVFPPDLEIYIKNGIVSTNVQEPYTITFETIKEIFQINQFTDQNRLPAKNFLAIDTKGNVENFENYQTFILITQKSLIISEGDKNRFYNLDPKINVIIDEYLIKKIITQITPILNYIAPIMLGFIFLGLFMFVPLYYLSYIMFLACLLWVLTKIMKFELSYLNCYKLGLHMCTITALLFGLLNILNINLNIPFLQTLILLVWGVKVLSTIKKTMMTPPASPFTPTISNIKSS